MSSPEGRAMRSRDLPVAGIYKSPRAGHAIRRLRVTTLGQLEEFTERDIMSLPKVGETTLLELKRMLTSRGLSFRQDG